MLSESVLSVARCLPVGDLALPVNVWTDNHLGPPRSKFFAARDVRLVAALNLSFPIIRIDDATRTGRVAWTLPSSPVRDRLRFPARVLYLTFWYLL